MKKVCLAALVLGLLGATAQTQNTLSMDDLVQSAQAWASNNLEDSVLKAFQDNLDRDQVQEFLATVQKDFQGDYVVDLAQLRDTARAILPLLEGHAETRPYALWLKARMDYFDAAQELRLSLRPPATQPGQTPAPPTNPAPQNARAVWIKKTRDRPAPKEAKPLVSELKPIFATERIPPQLVWLAEVESSFDPRARSPAGAAGLFQLMPATAKRFGLSTWPRDQRLNTRENARAAAQYLGALHARFKDWRLALAAYNAGEGAVQQLLDRHKTKSFDAIATQLPAETQMYVPKVEAVLLRREGVKLDELNS